jgi:radical SAM protein with 4Fe4S-binding SPASM domain
MINKLQQFTKNLGMKIYYRTQFLSVAEGLFNTQLYSLPYSLLIKVKAKRFAEAPKFIDIETTNFCNARCVMCPNPTLKRKKGTMPMRLFKKIVNEISESYPNIKRVNLSWLGEPLLDPHIFERAEYLKKKLPKTEVKFFTNGSLLTKERTRRLLNSNLDYLNISFNGATKTSYEKIMGLNYPKTKQNVRYLLNQRQRRNLKKPKIIISCMYLKENKNEAEKFLKEWSHLADSAILSMPMNWGGSLKLKRAYHLPRVNRNWPCLTLFKSMIVAWDGKVVPCCMDSEAEFTLGNVNKSTLKQVWEGKKAKALRTLHLRGEGAKISICQNCENLIRGVTKWWSA